MDVAPEAYTIAGFCQAYAVGKTTAFEEIKAGRLPIRYRGRRALIRKADADEWLSSLPSSRQKRQAAGS